MQQHQDLIAEVMQSPTGPEIGAFFDFDGTLISGYSAVTFIQEQVSNSDRFMEKSTRIIA